jgi:dipeptidyl aminopeptidase/acylaminoacyl peptidase
MRIPSIPLTLTLLLLPALAAEPGPEPRRVPIDSWLALDPLPLHAPAAAGNGEPLPLERIAEGRRLDLADVQPAQGESVRLPDGGKAGWRRTEAPEGVLPEVVPPDGTRGVLAYYATYVETDRFVEARLTVDSAHSVRARVGGRWQSCGGSEGVEVPLPTGKRLLWLEVLRARDAGGERLASVELVLEDAQASLRITADPRHGLRLEDVLEVEEASRVRVSADGTRVAVDLSDPAVPAEGRRHWQEIRDASSGRLLRDSGAARWKSLRWAPEGDRFAYAVDGDDGAASLWIDDSGTARKLVEGIQSLSGLRWAPDGRSLFYAAELGDAKKADEEEPLARRVRSLADRREGFRDKTQLFQVDAASGARRLLTAGDRSAALQDVRQDGAQLIFTRTRYHDDRRPFESTEIWQLDLDRLEPREVATVVFGATVRYAPDGSGLLIQAAPSAFDRIGIALPFSETPNDYDAQLYRLDPASGDVEALTEDFAPSVASLHVPARGSDVYLRVVEGPANRLYRLELETRRFAALDAGIENVDTVSVARDGSRVAWIGSSADLPPRVQVSLAADGQWAPQTLSVPAAGREEHLVLGTVEDWEFETDDGTRIDGRVHYPPDFDPQRRYPAIVYYYGGTAPVTRDFGGRYPKNVWASHGYVVYVLQPSGTVGYGQEFSARHVNDWGRRVAPEIIAASKAFLDAHPFVDPDRVGCIGASFGGFMTQLLITRTDMFAAAISHAGISSISSYWGEGHWGYAYNAVSAAGSYPWNSPEVYIEQSPLFHADAITTPLLLLHGAADPNVPPGESRQMFTALRVLGKPVELIEIPGEPHWILQLDKRMLWSKTIIAWFDRELRDRPAFWNHLYPVDEVDE